LLPVMHPFLAAARVFLVGINVMQIALQCLNRAGANVDGPAWLRLELGAVRWTSLQHK
jgi:hypothetical protein